MHIALILAPVAIPLAALVRLGTWIRSYFESTLWPTTLDEGR